jgi:hypothetical protein
MRMKLYGNSTERLKFCEIAGNLKTMYFFFASRISIGNIFGEIKPWGMPKG